jgi:hypothetical protein
MIARMLLFLFGILALDSATSAKAQDESRLHRDFRVEGEALTACTKFTFANLTDCGKTLVTGQPMHIAVGNLAPQNGFGTGLAFVEHKNFANEWRANWNVDAQATPNGSWRAGGYMKAYRLAGGTIHMQFPGPEGKSKTPPLFTSAPLLNFYSQSTSLNRVDYFGLGPNTTPLIHATYGFSENITGTNIILPIAGSISPARLSVVAELNGRFPSVRPGSDATLPSIGRFFVEATAPGLTRQPAYIQPSEGLRVEPALFNDRIRLNYLLQFQQFIAPTDSSYSFRRWNADFRHEIPLYRLLPGKLGHAYSANRAALFQYNGPDDCTGSNTGNNISSKRAAAAKVNPAVPCPIISTTQKLEGSITLRAFISESFADRGSVVPFYLSPTIGGSDINGTVMLASYPDYRFRGPDLLLFRASLEHSLGKLPLGAIFSVDEGKIGLRRDDISLDHLRHSFTIGLTVHAGGLPVFDLLFAWGGQEGTHTTANVSASLLGGSSRPSLF